MAGIYGTNGPDNLVGTPFDDHFEGFLGYDTLRGGAGNDRYILDDRDPGSGHFYDWVIEGVGQGIDRVLMTAIDDPRTPSGTDGYTLPVNVEHCVVEGLLAFNLTGNALANSLQGNDGPNTLSGGDGNDKLDGSLGLDTLIGGAGNDVYELNDLTAASLLDSRYDGVVEQAGGGTDTVRVLALDAPGFLGSVDGYALPDQVENGIILGALAFNLGGNARPNKLDGNSGKNRLTGEGGADMLNGGLGYDTLAGGPGNDVYRLDDFTDFGIFGSRYDIVEEAPNAGSDTVIVTAFDLPFITDEYSLTANVENGTIAGTRAFALYGNGLANRLTGNGGANRLSGGGGGDSISGGGGNDLLFGGFGNDVLNGGPGADRFAFDTALNSAANVDRLSAFTAADDTILLDRAIFTRIGPNGSLAAAAFRTGTAAADASDRIIYDPSTGNIFYDRDGAGDAAQRLFAQVAPGTALGRTDFVAYSGFLASPAAGATGAAGSAGAEAGRAMDDALAMVGAAGQADDLGMIDLPVI